jgi:hypothetical protein
MRARKTVILLLFVLLVSLSSAGPVSAHQTVTVGPYNIEIGWLNEPPVIGQVNAIVLNLTSSDGSDTPVTEPISQLTLVVSYGGQAKNLTLQPLGEDTPGQYVAPILPTVPGLYTVDLTAIQVKVQPEEVQSADVIQFPRVETGENPVRFTWKEGIGIAALVIAIGALVVAILAWKKRA